MNTKNKPSKDAGLTEAANKLFQIGRHHGWWPGNEKSWQDLDPISQEEFLDLTAEIVDAYKAASP